MLWGRVLQDITGSEEVAIRLLTTLSRKCLDDNDQPALQSWRSSRLPSSIMALLEDPTSSYTAQDCTNAAPQDGVLASPSLTSTWTLDLPSVSQDGASRLEFTHEDLSQSQTTDQNATQTEEIHEDLPPNQATDPDRPPSQSKDQEQSKHQALPQSQSTDQVGDISAQERAPATDYTIAPSQLPPDWHRLVQGYLSYEESWLPVLRKSSIWKMAYAYEASYTHLSEFNRKMQGDAATLWAVLALGSLHLDGGMSAASQTIQAVAYALLTPHVFEPDANYAAAFLLWSVIHSSRHEFALAKMKLAQAYALTTLPSSDFPNSSAQSLSNACFVLDTLIALATRTKPMNLILEPSLTALDEGELDEWEPFVDPLSLGSSKPRPSRTSSAYHHFSKLCSVLRIAFRDDIPRSTAEATFAHWARSCPDHLRFDYQGHDLGQDNSIPSETNIRVCSLIACSIFADSESNTVAHSTSITFDGPKRAEMLNALLLSQQHTDLRRLPSSMSIMADCLLTIITGSPGAFSLDNTPSSIRSFNAILCRQFDWRGCAIDGACETAALLDNGSARTSLLAQNHHAPVTIAPVDLMSQIVLPSGGGAANESTQQDNAGDSSIYQTRSRQAGHDGADNTTLFCRDLTTLPAVGLSNTVAFDPEDSALPDTYMDLFLPNERFVEIITRFSTRLLVRILADSLKFQSGIYACIGLR